MKLVGATIFLICSFALSLLAASAQNIGSQYQNQYQGENYGNSSQFSGQTPSSAVRNTSSQQLRQWFSAYDMVRKQAQMSPIEKDRADNLLSQGLSVFVPGPNKMQAQKLLTGLVDKYQVAINKMKAMPLYPETEKLHRGYYQYFSDARVLFSDYLKVQNEPFAKDPNTGERLIGQIVRRKQSLAELEANVKNLDQGLRNRFGIKAYQY